MAANVLVRLVADSTMYEAAMVKAKQSLEKWEKAHDPVNQVIGKTTEIVGKLAAGLGVAMGAQEAFNKTISSTQTLTDEYSRVMASATGVIDSFFASLAQGDFSGFISGLNEVIASARQAYDDLDRLGSMDVFKGKEDAAYNRQRAELRYKIRQNPNDQEFKKQLEDLDAGYQGRIMEEADQARKSYFSSMRSVLREQGAFGSDSYLDEQIKRSLDSFGSYEAADKRYRQLEDMIKAGATTVRSQGSGQFGGGGVSTTFYSKEAQGIMNSQEYKMLRAIAMVGDEALKEVNQLQARADNAIAGVFNNQLRDLMLGGAGKKTGAGSSAVAEIVPEGSLKELQNKIAEAQKAAALAVGEDAQIQAQEVVNKLQEELNNKTFIIKYKRDFEEKSAKYEEENGADWAKSPTLLNALPPKVLDEMKKKLQPVNGQMNELTGQKDKVDELSGALSGLAGTMSAFGQSAVSDILRVVESMVKLVDTFEQIDKIKKAGGAVSDMAGFGAVLGVFGSLAGLLFADGGLIPSAASGRVFGGTNYQDGITARVSSGEMVMNEHDQKRLFDDIHNGNISGGGGSIFARAEDLVIVMNNWGKRKGLGRLQFG